MINKIRLPFALLLKPFKYKECLQLKEKERRRNQIEKNQLKLANGLKEEK